jgi:hypothetical protein
MKHLLAGIKLNEFPYTSNPTDSVKGFIGTDGPVNVSCTSANVQCERKALLPPNVIETINQSTGNLLAKIIIVYSIGAGRPYFVSPRSTVALQPFQVTGKRMIAATF